MPLTRSERERLIQQYADGPARLEGALAAVPAAARQWRPAPGEWSAHEVACHCADSEINAAARIRYLVCEPEPVVLGYDENVWAVDARLPRPSAGAGAGRRARGAGQHRRPAPAPARGGLERAKGATPRRAGTPRRTGSRIYAEHLENHARQIEANVAAWQARRPP